MGQLGEGRLCAKPSSVNDDHLVDGLRDLGEHVAGDQNRAPLAGQRPQEVAQPADALRIEAIGRLIQDQRLRVAEEGGGEIESLLHAERVRLHPPPGHAARAPPGEAPRPPARPVARPRARSRAGGCVPCGPGGNRSCPAPRRRWRAGPVATDTRDRRWWRCRRWAPPDRAGPAEWSSCPLRWGQGSRGSSPIERSNVSPSTATVAP